MLLVVLCAADHPEVSTHGLLAVSKILLGNEGCLVGRDVRQVVSTLGNHRTNGCKTSTNLELLGGRLRGALVRFRSADVQTCAVRVGGRFLAVRTNQVSTTAVTVLDGGFGQATLNVIDTGSVFNFSHSLLAMTRVTRDLVAR